MRTIIVTALIAALVTALFAALLHSGGRPLARDCLDACRAAGPDFRAFYGHDGACLCLPPCPAVCPAGPLPVTAEDQEEEP